MRRASALVLLALLVWFGVASAAPPGQPAATRSTLFGVSTFPYGPSPEAAEQTFRTAADLSDIYVVQLDDGVPWAEAAADGAFPAGLTRKWQSLRSHAPAGQPVYLALEPLAEDRVSLAPPVQGSAPSLQRAAFDDPALIRAYLAYARRAVRFFQPAYLNLGVENGELAFRRPGEWPAYAKLITTVMTALRAEFPSLRIGISFGLQSLMEPATAERVRGLVEASDYIGLSFYPYMSAFHEKFGTSGLPPAPDQWRKPLDWVRAYTRKPIAICETGYSTRPVNAAQWRLQMAGSPALQSEYVRDLARYAARDDYLFVVYYLPIDIGPILDSLPPAQRDSGNLWRDTGLLDAGLAAKPGLAAWKDILATRYQPPAAATPAAATPVAATPVAAPVTPENPGKAAGGKEIGFRHEEELCDAPSPSRVSLVDGGAGGKALLWDYKPAAGGWSWCARSFAGGGFPAGDRMAFRIRSDAEGPLVLQLKGAADQSYYAMVQAGPGWRDVSLSWEDFRPEPANRRAARVDPGRITKVVWADDGKTWQDQAQRRRVWISDWAVR